MVDSKAALKAFTKVGLRLSLIESRMESFAVWAMNGANSVRKSLEI